MNIPRLLLPAIVTAITLSLQAALPHVEDAEPAETSSSAISAYSPVNDELISTQLVMAGERLLNNSKYVKLTELRRQLSRKQCAMLLPRAGARLRGADLMARSQKGVLIVAKLYKCSRCHKWHAQAASGFWLTASGVLATCYHVVASNEGEFMFVMARDGRTAPIMEVLAASERNDVALLRAEGAGFTPLPISTNAPVGAPVRVISHPDMRFFTLTEGIIARYFIAKEDKRDLTMMEVTADFAKSSSGAPVFNEDGAVVGLACCTRSIYYNEVNGVKDNLQMVCKQCVPVRYLLDLIR